MAASRDDRAGGGGGRARDRTRIPVIDGALVDAWLRLAADRIRAERDVLTALDAAIGDGDHGINLDRGFSLVIERLEGGRLAAGAAPQTGGAAAAGGGDAAAAGGSAAADPSPTAGGAAAADPSPTAGPLLTGVGRTIVGTVGGASGALYGRAFLRAGGRLSQEPAPIGEFVEALAAAAVAIGEIGRSTTGEKTMLDALVPAIEALREASGRPLAVALSAAADAAEAGAAATIPMLATKGRASYLGERSIGHQDPGATSTALILRALADVAR